MPGLYGANAPKPAEEEQRLAFENVMEVIVAPKISGSQLFA